MEQGYAFAFPMENAILICSYRPSSRVAAAERKLRLVNDPQAKSFRAHDVECAVCGVRVDLKGDGHYNLTSWEEHKERCEK